MGRVFLRMVCTDFEISDRWWLLIILERWNLANLGDKTGSDTPNSSFAIHIENTLNEKVIVLVCIKC